VSPGLYVSFAAKLSCGLRHLSTPEPASVHPAIFVGRRSRVANIGAPLSRARTAADPRTRAISGVPSAIREPKRTGFFANITHCPRSSAGRSFWCDLLPDCDGATRRHIRPGASRQRPRGLCSLVPDDRGVALCWRPSSAHEPTGKHRQVSIRSDGYRCDALIPIRARSRPVPAPPHVRPGPYCSRASGRPRGRPPLGFL
jgi:hypothetical protein